MEGESEVVMLYYISTCEFNMFKENITLSVPSGCCYIWFKKAHRNMWEFSSYFTSLYY